VSAGLAILFRCPWWAVLAASVAGGVVGVITRIMGRNNAAAAIVPFVAAFVSTVVIGGVVDVFDVGVGLTFGSGPRLTAVTVIAMACTYALLLLFTPLVGKSVATGLTVAILFIASRLLARLSPAVPGAAFFQPAFLLLVPGSLGLVALAGFDEEDVTAALGVFIALCIGTKVGAFGADLLRPKRTPTR
jgi:uncharacterized membrane protein YjjB (DUF3815 family)